MPWVWQRGLSCLDDSTGYSGDQTRSWQGRHAGNITSGSTTESVWMTTVASRSVCSTRRSTRVGNKGLHKATESEAARGAVGPRDLGSDHHPSLLQALQPRANPVGCRRNRTPYSLHPPMVEADTLPIDSRVISDGAICRAPWPPASQCGLSLSLASAPA